MIALDGTAILIDDEMEPQPVCDEYLAIGSGSAYAVGAMDAGASAERAGAGRAKGASAADKENALLKQAIKEYGE